ncbi:MULTISPECIES: hypothetical protein [Acetobacter]|uniref:Uncharacterized protein n=1 Tax=Acetobacter ascendens TaxID=481146 RepID=A0A1Y0V158_9PROT|nr:MULTISPECIES: hypothetical protein [Acetobacter]ARW11910.1 hypothetical protein S101447_02873 [Acetobacter ascendens]KAA8388755.1 hypothetical protein FKW31_00280 [Acetobacter sp. DmW_136]RCL04535.1 hypothetical protein BBA71_12970 [Acetobacter pasteurianus]GCD76326.1 hypothetical protein NBRC3299_2618 [Acetobacter pasteurianus NBRC 3299]
MNLARAIMIRKERKRQRREGASRREKLSVFPLLWDTLAADRQLQRTWKAEGVPFWKRLLRAFLIQG